MDLRIPRYGANTADIRGALVPAGAARRSNWQQRLSSLIHVGAFRPDESGHASDHAFFLFLRFPSVTPTTVHTYILYTTLFMFSLYPDTPLTTLRMGS